MLWIKRNLFLAVGGLIALLVLLGGLYYVWRGIQRNSELDEKVRENQSRLNGFYGSPEPFPSQNNIDLAKAETEKLRQAAARSHKFFTPVPAEKVTGIQFRTYRDRTLAELRKDAAAADTKLPNNLYAFSFLAQKDLTQFSPGTFPLVPEQMAEVRALCEVLFKASAKQIGNIRRARVSDEDARTGGTDYLTMGIITNTEAHVVTSPYEITFYSFSGSLAQIMSAFATAPFGVVLKAIQVEGEDASKGFVDSGAPQSGTPPVGAAGTPPRPPIVRPGQPPPRPLPPGVGAASPKPGTFGARPRTILDEKPFKVTLLLYVVKPLK